MKKSVLIAGFTAALSAASISSASVVDLSTGTTSSGGITSGRCDYDALCTYTGSGEFAFTTSSAYNGTGGIYLHDDSGALRTELWRKDGKRFDAQALSFNVGANWYKSGPDAFVWADPDAADGNDPDFIDWTTSGQPPSELYFNIRGYRDGAAVADHAFGAFWGAFDFDKTFMDLDYLEFELGYLNAEFYYPYRFNFIDMPPNTLWCQDWCVGFGADTLTYSLSPTLPAAVPLPPAGLALAAALMGLMVIARRKGFQA